MATRQVLADLIADYERSSGDTARLESVGGVDAARRVQAGEAFDVVVLAAKAIDDLMGTGHALAGSRTDLVHSGVAVAVRAGAQAPDIATEAGLRDAVLQAGSVGYSTGPSGVALLALFDRWGVTEQIRDRIRQAPPGQPVAQMVAQGEVALGFQQLSEMLNVQGIRIVGPLPAKVQIITTFSAAITNTCADASRAQALIDFMARPQAALIKERQGMQAA